MPCGSGNTYFWCSYAALSDLWHLVVLFLFIWWGLSSKNIEVFPDDEAELLDIYNFRSMRKISSYLYRVS